ncbi:MAG: rod shape-determining protein [Desulfobacterales bacterium]
MKFNGILSAFSSDLAVDLGTANTRIHAKGHGVVLNEPSIVAVRKMNGSHSKAIAFGTEAKDMQGKTPADITLVHPIRDGVIADFEAIAALLKFLIRKIHGRHQFVKPRIVFAVPNAITEVEKRAIRETAEMVGARAAMLVNGPVAAAIGAGMPVADATCSMIVDIGAGKTEAAAISLLGIVYCQAIQSSGNHMDFAISQHVKNTYELLVGDSTAEIIKQQLSCRSESNRMDQQIEIRGRDPHTGIPKTMTIAARDISQAIAGQIDAIARLIKIVLEKIPPELSADVIDRGITLTGGVALLGNLSRYLGQELCLNVKIAPDPLCAGVVGAARLLADEQLLQRAALE